MVIDQVEVIENQRCRDVLGELALSLPAGSRLGFGSRSEPPITVARLRSQGRLLDVTFGDLAMVESEAHDLLTAAGVDVEPELLHELLLLTEGWPAGLYLAALSFRAGGDPAANAVHSTGITGSSRTTCVPSSSFTSHGRPSCS